MGKLADWETGPLGPWTIGALGPWTIGALGPWTIGALGPWTIGALGPWTIGALGPTDTKRPQIDVHGPDSERPFGAVRLSELRIASVIGSVCSERTKTHYLITRGPLSASANAKNERIPGLRNFGQGPGRVGVVVVGGAI